MSKTERPLVRLIDPLEARPSDPQASQYTKWVLLLATPCHRWKLCGRE